MSPTSCHPHARPEGIGITDFAGGEGATAREVLRHQSVEEVIMVDIDKARSFPCRHTIRPAVAAASAA